MARFAIPHEGTTQGLEFMFKELGQFASMMRAMPAMKEKLERFQKRLPQLTAEGTAGEFPAQVTVHVNGQMETISCRIPDQALMVGGGRLGEMVQAATNIALLRVRAQIAAEMSEITGGMNLPPGMFPGLPGLPG
jgi:DNA-binding protein YbaB